MTFDGGAAMRRQTRPRRAHQIQKTANASQRRAAISSKNATRLTIAGVTCAEIPETGVTLQPLEIGSQFGGGLAAHLAIFFESFVDDFLEPGRNSRI